MYPRYILCLKLLSNLKKSVNSIIQLLCIYEGKCLRKSAMIRIYYLSISDDLYSYVPEEALCNNGHAGKTGSIFLIKLVYFVFLARGHKSPPLRFRSPRYGRAEFRIFRTHDKSFQNLFAIRKLKNTMQSCYTIR